MPRDLPVPGRELGGVHFAMEYLYQRNRFVARELGPLPEGAPPPPAEPISAAGKHVVVIGGGDTGADCVGNAHREGAASVTQIELVGEPPPRRPDDVTPVAALADEAPHLVRAEGGRRARLRDHDDAASPATAASSRSTGRRTPASRPSSRSPAPRRRAPRSSCCWRWASSGPSRRCSTQLGVERDARGNADAPAYATSADGVFAAGDARRGQSLIVWAINEGRQCAAAVDRWLAWIPSRRSG